jgi:ATP:ADP antiporter, AAA family
MSSDSPSQFSYFKKLFFPLTAMLAAVTLAGPCINRVVRLEMPADLPPPVLGVMELSVALLSTLLMVLFILITRKVAMQKWIKGLLLAMIAAFFLAYLGIKFFSLGSVQTDSQFSIWLMQTLPMPLGHLIAAAIREWRFGLLLLLSATFSSSLLLVMVWGFINQVTRFTEAMKFYIALLFLADLSRLSEFLIIKVVNIYTSPEACYLMVVVCLAAAWGIFTWTCRRLPVERWQDDTNDPKSQRNYFCAILAFGLLIAGLMIVKQYSFTILNALLQLRADTDFDLGTFYAQIASAAGVVALIVTALSLVLGPWLLHKWGWGMTALIPPLAVLGTLLVIVLGGRYQLMPVSYIGYHQGLLAGLKGALLIPLIQMAYIFFPKSYRFQLNGWSTLIAAPIISQIAAIPSSGLLYFVEDPLTASTYLIGVAALILLLMAFAILYLSPQKA